MHIMSVEQRQPVANSEFGFAGSSMIHLTASVCDVVHQRVVAAFYGSQSYMGGRQSVGLVWLGQLVCCGGCNFYRLHSAGRLE